MPASPGESGGRAKSVPANRPTIVIRGFYPLSWQREIYGERGSRSDEDDARRKTPNERRSTAASRYVPILFFPLPSV